ncbi:MAG: DUF1207 domain-containing protein [Solirubrobacterales bacterium]
MPIAPKAAPLAVVLCLLAAGAGAEEAPPQPPNVADAKPDTGTPDTGKLGTGAVVLPRQALFDPLIADPRWTHFSATWQYWGGDSGLQNVGAASLGHDFSFYQAPLGEGRWDFGLQAGVFAIFDLDAASKDLVNADYWVGIPLSYRQGPWQGRVRLYHQSSHLGDEYLLRVRPQRINLSYEAVDLKISRTFVGDAVRLYGGVGWMFDRDPSDLDPWMGQVGVELRSPWSLADGVRPILAVDLQSAEESHWQIDSSVRAGVELENLRDSGYRLMLLLEYFHGRNPNGQFYDTTIDTWGIGIHAYF